MYVSAVWLDSVCSDGVHFDAVRLVALYLDAVRLVALYLDAVRLNAVHLHGVSQRPDINDCNKTSNKACPSRQM